MAATKLFGDVPVHRACREETARRALAVLS